jgi:neutral ceramidase
MTGTKGSRSLSWLVGLGLVLCGALLTGESHAGWKAGTGAVKITPDPAIWMAGYGGRDHVAEGVLHDLWSKALVLEDGRGERVVLVTLDLCGIGRDVSEAICAGLKAQQGLDRRRIAINCSHTHTGPAIRNNLVSMYFYDADQARAVGEYTDRLVGLVQQSVAEAIKTLAPAEVLFGQGQTTFAVNRRANKEDQVPKLREEGLLKGPNDHAVPVLAVKGADGKFRAIVCGYACHATVLSFYQYSGDYPGFTQLALEKTYPGAQAMFVAGCGADQNPLPRRTVELAEHYGRMLAEATEQVVLTGLAPVGDRAESLYAEVPLAYAKVPTRADLLAEGMSTDRYVANRAKQLLARIDAGETLSPTYPYPVQAWSLGKEVEWVFLGGEVVVDYVLRLKTELKSDRLWVSGYSNDVMAYIPSKRVLVEGGYEGGGSMTIYGLPSIWGGTVEETVVGGTLNLTRQLRGGQ